MATIVPNLGQQLSDIITFVDRLSRENEDMDRLPFGPPICETMKAASIPYQPTNKLTRIVAEVMPAKPHIDYTGTAITDARECPHCGCTCYSSAVIGQTVNCLHCGRVFRWSNI